MLQMVTPEDARALIVEHTVQIRGKTIGCTDATGLILADGVHGLEAGQEVNGPVVALLTSRGLQQVQVVPHPCIVVISVGSEAAGDPCRACGQMLAAMTKQLRIPDPHLFEAFDTLEDLSFVLDHVSRADIVVLAGGDSELVHEVMSAVNASVVFDSISQEPGGPMLFAIRGARLFFSLPAEPHAALVCYDHYVSPAVRKMMGRPPDAVMVHGQLTSQLTVEAQRTRFMLADTRQHNGGHMVTPIADGASYGMANTYLRLPPGCHDLPRGSEVAVQWIGQKA